jgi:CBS domain-containing protein
MSHQLSGAPDNGATADRHDAPVTKAIRPTSRATAACLTFARVICPQCGFDNIQGVDECENCGFDLMSVDIPSPSTTFEAELVRVPLADLAHHRPLTIASTATAADAVRQMQEAGAGCLIVADGGRVRGILSERDLIMKLEGASVEGRTVGDLMTADPVVLRPDDSIAVAINKMAVGGFRHIPLVVDGQPTGIVSARDVFRHILANTK